MAEIQTFDLGYCDENEYTRVVCVSRYKGKYVFCYNKKRNGWEIPGGHIENGETPVDDMIKGVKEGLLIKVLQGLHAGLNPISGDFSCQASGYLIKDGKIDRPVTLIVVSGNFLEMLSNVEAVGNDFKYLYNGFGSPSVLFKGLPVSGK